MFNSYKFGIQYYHNIFCRSLKCTRIRIHIQLFISFALNNIMWIIWYKEVIPNTMVLLQNEVGILKSLFYTNITNVMSQVFAKKPNVQSIATKMPILYIFFIFGEKKSFQTYLYCHTQNKILYPKCE